MERLLEQVQAIEDKVIAIRRDLHEHPEVSMEEERTIQVVTKELERLNIKYEVIPYGGVIGYIEGSQPGKTLVLRADLDALPMKESPKNLTQEKVVVSKYDDAAHTCGHDGHTAMLLGAANILAKQKDQLRGRILLAFEQGEEDGKGIFRLLRRLVEIGADGVWGIHLKSDIPSGKISVDPGPRMAGVYPFHIEIVGKGGHGSRPDLSASPIDCFHTFYQQFLSLRKRLDPYKPITFSIGKLTAGSTANVIPDTLQFQGTARFLHFDQGEAFEQQLKHALKKACELHHCTYNFVTPTQVRPLFVYNEETCANLAKEAITEALGEEVLYKYSAWMASEPFALYQKYFPGIFAFVGTENEMKGTGAEHHNAHFDIDEDVLKLGIVAMVKYVEKFLQYPETISYEREERAVKQLFIDLGLSIYQPEVKD